MPIGVACPNECVDANGNRKRSSRIYVVEDSSAFKVPFVLTHQDQVKHTHRALTKNECDEFGNEIDPAILGWEPFRQPPCYTLSMEELHSDECGYDLQNPFLYHVISHHDLFAHLKQQCPLAHNHIVNFQGPACFKGVTKYRRKEALGAGRGRFLWSRMRSTW